MSKQSNVRTFDPLLMLILLYGAASLLHFSHNAIFIDDYPNLPVWLSSTKVYAAWIGISLVGVIGYSLFRGGYTRAGLFTIAAYAALGFDGLAHYSRAPLAAHSLAMNLTIWLEVLTAAVLLLVAMVRLAGALKSVRTAGC